MTYKIKPLILVMCFVGLVGGIVGLGGFTFYYGEGLSYFKDDPKACTNCHIMRSVFDGWNHGTHKAVASCNSCHAPHDLAGKLIVKGINGFNHSVAFTSGRFNEPIRISKLNRRIALNNCLYCHGDLVIHLQQTRPDEPLDCLKCHSGVGHGR